MGLFGGFRAKFTRESTAKPSKNTQDTGVVCVGYRIRSEFDDLPSTTVRVPALRLQNYNEEPPSEDIPSKSCPDSKKEKSPKKKLPPLPDKFYANLNDKSSNKVKSSATSNIVNKPVSTEDIPSKSSPNLRKEKSPKKNPPPLPATFHVNQNDKSSNKVNTSATSNTEAEQALTQAESKTSEESESSYVRGKTSSFNPNPKKQTKSILKATNSPSKEIRRPVSDGSVTVATLKESRSVNSSYASLSYTNHQNTSTTSGSLTTSRFVSEDQREEVATLIHTEVTERKIVNNNSNYSSTPNLSYGSRLNNTSSHAASIFFDGDDEPEIEQRPRKLDYETDDDRRVSADC
ncbi:probable serine/threonine-protein kinase DDB_G0276461 isoform X2 [Sitophilus oryzae]|uniref:Probable serine/threonine-protein kinase DDB_G0276461 isoform X2 n=1 Tax=Sitophilus oryzae TaxID=7048 RepID=A0A6J2XDK9_SITOR|nr:probable serine/threonine-protein kinase DDB_G0276461 isoform X2 [Sitophilus oryzae]